MYTKTTKSAFNLSFVGIGAQKAGTTWLARVLNEHPEICISEPKEVNFFNLEGGYHEKRKFGRHYPDIHWYSRHFRHANTGQKLGEISTNYMWDKNSAERIHRLFPKVKILVCLRDPVARTYSHYLFLRFRAKYENRSFQEVLDQEPEYLKRSMYYDQLKPYYELFEEKQIFIMIMEDIKNDPVNLCSRLFNFLQVEDTFIPEILYQRANKTKQVRFKWLSRAEYHGKRILAEKGGSPLIAMMKKLGIHHFYLKYNYKEASLPELSTQDKASLKQVFTDDISRLQELTKRDYSVWK